MPLNHQDVTVIVPHQKRREAFFRQFCLPSIERNQPGEILVYDDTSHPNTKRNRGLAEAKTPYVVFCDDDVILANDFIARLRAALVSGPYSVAYCDYVGICLPGVEHPHAREGTHHQKSQPFSAPALEQENYIDSTSLFRKEDVPRFDETLPRFHDWDVVLQMARGGKQGVYVPKTLFYSFHIDRGITASTDRLVALDALSKKHGLSLQNAEPTTVTDMRTTVIQAGKIPTHYWRDLYQHRHAFFMLVRRDFIARYKQTVLGVLWSVIRPLLTTAALVFTFRYVGGVSESQPMIVLLGVILWNFFAYALPEGVLSLVANRNIITKIYAPRMLFPLAAVALHGIDMIFLFLIALPFLYRSGADILHGLLWLLPIVLLIVCLTAGTVLLLAPINILYRDIKHLIPFILQVGIFVSPVGYVTSTVPELWQRVFTLNPLVGIIDTIRWGFYPTMQPFPSSSLVIACLFTVLLCTIGVLYFRHKDARIPENI